MRHYSGFKSCGGGSLASKSLAFTTAWLTLSTREEERSLHFSLPTLTDCERSSPDFCLDHVTLSTHQNGTGQTQKGREFYSPASHHFIWTSLKHLDSEPRHTQSRGEGYDHPRKNKHTRIGMLVWKLSSMVNIQSLDEMGCVPLEEGIHDWGHESLSTLFMHLQIHQISLRSRKMRVTFSTMGLIWPGQRPVPWILHSF